MDISRSSNRPEACLAGACLFSGRPDPVWKIGDEVVKQLEQLWESLEHQSVEPPSPPPLGYRGCFLKCEPGTDWFAYHGVVTKKTPDRNESRMDRNREFEKVLLASAPHRLAGAGFDLPIQERQ